VTIVQACTVVIASPDRLPELKRRNGTVDAEVLTFSDTDALRALEEIVRRHPRAVELDRQFAATPRGAALINRIKADPALAGSELRVVSHDSDDERILWSAAAAAPQAPASAVAILEPPPMEAPPVAAPPLDLRGTRRAPRFRITGEVSVQLDGNAAKLVDQSTVGAQVISPTILKPNQRVRVALADDHGAWRFNAAIAWASFEIPRNVAPQYRAGVNFVDANSDAVGAFCLRHKA
jgi:PilZ domain-containing protein